MRISFLSFLFFINITFCNAQCSVNAGTNVQICLVGDGKFDTVHLTPIVTGAVGPITSTWELSYKHSFGNYYTFGSMLLDDTSALNASIVRSAPISGWVPIIVKITDSIGNQCSDTIELRFSQFLIFAADCIAYIKPGDSTFLSSPIDGGIPPMTYTWTSNTGDSVPSSLIVKPQHTTFYTCEAKDSIGCSRTSICRIFVDTTHVGIQDLNESKINAVVLPNPFTQTFSVAFDNPNRASFTFRLHDLLGKQIGTRLSNNNNEDFNLANYANGFYILSIEDENKNIVFKQRLKKE
jgi:hypothetical protein